MPGYAATSPIAKMPASLVSQVAGRTSICPFCGFSLPAGRGFGDPFAGLPVPPPRQDVRPVAVLYGLPPPPAPRWRLRLIVALALALAALIAGFLLRRPG